MFKSIVNFFQKLFRIGKAVEDVSTAAQSVHSAAKGGGVKAEIGAVAKAAVDVGNAGDSIGDAVK